MSPIPNARKDINGRYVRDGVVLEGTPDHAEALVLDPQTSGGLLLSVPGDEAAGLIGRLQRAGVLAARVGSVHAGAAVVRVIG